MTLNEAIALSGTRRLTSLDAKALCAQLSQDHAHALDLIAREVAARYLDNDISFDVADDIMNAAWAYSIDLSAIPTFMREIYEAFDAGEYLHAGDQPGTDNEAKYTKPYLRESLARLAPPNTSLERTRDR